MGRFYGHISLSLAVEWFLSRNLVKIYEVKTPLVSPQFYSGFCRRHFRSHDHPFKRFRIGQTSRSFESDQCRLYWIWNDRDSTVTGFLRDDRAQIVAMADPNRKSGSYGYRGEKEGGRLVGMQIVNEYYAEAEGRTHYRGCRAYEDFRDLLDNEDVDAVNISTPDHWHAVMAVYCANRKKHVYGQKPLAVTVDEGRKMVQAVNRNKITWQTGSQQRSESYFREAVEFVRNERIGKLKTIQIDCLVDTPIGTR